MNPNAAGDDPATPVETVSEHPGRGAAPSAQGTPVSGGPAPASARPQGRAAPSPPPEGAKEAWGGPALGSGPQGRAAPSPPPEGAKEAWGGPALPSERFRSIRSALPELPCDAQGPVFSAPWEAQAFAITLALHERGHFGWDEWADHLARAIRKAQANGDPDTGDTYYLHWLSALEALLLEKGIAGPLVLTALRQAWRVAAEATPHGSPIELGPAARARLRGMRRAPDV